MPNLTSFYAAPLARELGVTPQRALELVRKRILRKIRSRLMRSRLSDRAKRSFAQSLSVRVTKNRLSVLSSHPGFRHQLRGQRKGVMSWLLKAKKPIPIELESGEVIFRTVTAKSMTDGRWVHPGRDRHGFVEAAKREVTAEIKEMLVSTMRKAFRKVHPK